jgi:hypothetical protein
MHRYLPTALLILLIIAFRCVGSVFSETLPNFQPLCALFFCGALVSTGWRAWVLPFAVWLITYPLPALIKGGTEYLALNVIGVTAFAFALTFLFGKSLRSKGIPITLLGSVAAALLFHIITNGAAWIGSPMYAKTPEGLLQALWTGPVGSPLPTWVFLRNMLAANLLFTTIFLSTRFAVPSFFPKHQPSLAR